MARCRRIFIGPEVVSLDHLAHVDVRAQVGRRHVVDVQVHETLDVARVPLLACCTRSSRALQQDVVEVLGAGDRLLLEVELGQQRIKNHANIMQVLVLQQILVDVPVRQAVVVHRALLLVKDIFNSLARVLKAHVRVARLVQSAIVLKVELDGKGSTNKTLVAKATPRPDRLLLQ